MTKKINAKTKGKVFEKKIAKMFGVWMFNDEFALYASTGSGNRSTSLRKQGKTDIHPGDIHPVKLGIKLPFAIECKKVEKFFLEGYFSSKSPISKAIAKIRLEAKTHKLPWVLIYARNREKPVVLVEKILFQDGLRKITTTTFRRLVGYDFVALPLRNLFSDYQYMR
jgi:hypothetical protein